MRTATSTILLLLLLCIGANAQEYGYTNYNIREGLAGSTVYCMVEDKEGFLWFGTETGLSRFDGTHFKNFDKEDGLPDNEIMQLFVDSKGRLWIAPFKNALCYYYRGKIYNAQNDSTLKKIEVTGFVIRFAEDRQGNILFLQKGAFHLLRSNGEVKKYTSVKNVPFSMGAAVTITKDNKFRIFEDNRIYQFAANEEPALVDTIEILEGLPQYIAASEKIVIARSKIREANVFVDDLKYQIPFSQDHVIYTVIDTTQFACSTINGAYVYNVRNSSEVRHYLPGLTISSVSRDSEGNLWFCTSGRGVYRLNSEFVTNVRLGNADMPGSAVLSMTIYNGLILMGTNSWSVYAYLPATKKLRRVLSSAEDPVSLSITSFAKVGDNLVIGSTFGLNTLIENDSLWRELYFFSAVVKAMVKHPEGLMIATDKSVLLLKEANKWRADTLWRTRATSIYFKDDTLYFGTLAGLYQMLPDSSIKFLGDEHEVLKNRIVAICQSADGTYWMATYDEGIIGWKDNRIVARLTTTQGLSSNICHSLFLQDNYLWAGTNKGVNKIDIRSKDYPVRSFTTGDGLLSDIINAIYVTGTRIYLGTPLGLTYFDEQKITRSAACKLRITGITTGDSTSEYDNRVISLSPSQNNIRIDYVGISYKSAGDVRYRYRLSGLDSGWRETRETYLSYPSLPAGSYELQLQAFNRFNVASDPVMVRFVIEKSFLEKTWVRWMIVAILIGAVAISVFFFVRRIKQREEKKTATARHISHLEQLALKAQMNPHFIFNSLNSIQHYVMDKDISGANRFISSFSKLVRKTLDFSSRQHITLEEEIGYLTNYLDLEKTRSEDKFNYEVIIHDGIHLSIYYLPPMILQPYLENSIRHGIRYRRDNHGLIRISITKKDNCLVCTIEDNGIGRKASALLKGNTGIEYQSMGMSLTADRIAMLNKDSEQKISVKVEDLEDEHSIARGTRVTVEFPVMYFS